MRADPTDVNRSGRAPNSDDPTPGAADAQSSEQPGPEPRASDALDVLVRRVQREASTRGARRRPASLQRLGDLVPPTLPRGPALLALVVAVAVGFLGWRFVARPVPIDQRMPMARSDAAQGFQSGNTANGDTANGDTANGDTASSQSGAAPGEPVGQVGATGGAGSAAGGSGGAEVTLHVAGAVNRPGLVSVAEGARVADAAAAAGGLTTDADVQRVNLAAVVLDGSRVFIPAVGQEIPPEVPVGSGAATGNGEPAVGSPLDVNTADAEALEALPGVGPATAAAIVSHREEHGRFATVDALMDVRGIGEAKLEAMRDLVTVG